MRNRIKTNGLKVDQVLYELVNHSFIPGTDIEPARFWSSLADIVQDLTPVNRALLAKREELQTKINRWHLDRKRQTHDASAYQEFLRRIGYLLEEGDGFEVTTSNVDPEIASVAGPQLVAPMNNARYALNAANARWGSLYDALYGTDVLPEDGGANRSKSYNPVRGARVVAYAAKFLNQSVPLEDGSHADATNYAVSNGNLKILLRNDHGTQLRTPGKFSGYTGDPERPESILLKNHNLHIEIRIDHEHPVGMVSPAGIADVILESAITTIQDLEDSVATVDAEDKCDIYNHWFGLMKGNLTTSFSKNGKVVERALNPDRTYYNPAGSLFSLPGRSVMLIRHVGHLTTNPAILNADDNEVFEGIIDAMVTSLIALHDLNGTGNYRNSRTGSIYAVKPKMHGPEETAFAVKLFQRTEEALGMSPNTIKIGIMDEERRTTVNLKECIRQASDRIIFINTGFLDRTGDEIHTSMEAGPMIRKADMKSHRWIQAYEDRNVDMGLACGLPGHAQVGKGMWPMPDEMATMMKTKIGHPKSGANTAWVPSPTAATLHAMHYHEVNVTKRQQQLTFRSHASLDDILTLPVCTDPDWTEEDIQQELENNCQGILGYVVRWIDQGIGCSKVPDINNIGLMEDRATLRISSQHVANWLHHAIVTETQVMKTLEKMARVVDRQNEDDSNYCDMGPEFGGIAFSAAHDLIFRGRELINGYTEPILHAKRRKIKNSERATG